MRPRGACGLPRALQSPFDDRSPPGLIVPMARAGNVALTLVAVALYRVVAAKDSGEPGQPPEGRCRGSPQGIRVRRSPRGRWESRGALQSAARVAGRGVALTSPNPPACALA
jgi:hypothetical protein